MARRKPSKSGRRDPGTSAPAPSANEHTEADAGLVLAGTGAPDADARHVPVLLAEVIAALAPRDGGEYIDATFGAGGYARAILCAADTRVLAYDRDPTAIVGAGPTSSAFAPRLALRHAAFSSLLELAGQPGKAGTCDGVVFDLGVSSMQLDTPGRGFSFQYDGPLDMRMSAPLLADTGLPSVDKTTTAADVVNGEPEARLADILFHLGEERRSRAVAKAIVARRAERPFTRTLDLADVIARVVGRKPGDRIHPATRSFQALRMFVNDELGELARGLAGAERLLRPGGRLVVVTFHSLEDRVVKRFLAARSGKIDHGSRHLPGPAAQAPAPSFRIVNPRPLTSGQPEQELNPRARSARLRAAERTEAAAHAWDESGLEALGVPPV
ncbi:MAG: 16S rRNA (cytosine(1402)-N(4))-methyltransferase RsmH [Hyphomicrobiaceae bacterium]|nr:16S rRNA (cytosine(1402)-N(4))-methyltransferase RsmH [Hyphomicrobiaceae bacterium]